jgi:hypothetical protein
LLKKSRAAIPIDGERYPSEARGFCVRMRPWS